VDANDARKVIRPAGDEEGILGKHKAGEVADIVEMSNKPPRWNEQMQAYCLNFHGRVTQASVKNFQLVRPRTPAACVRSRLARVWAAAQQASSWCAPAHPLRVCGAAWLACGQRHNRLRRI
jgi:hypothetical protein